MGNLAGRTSLRRVVLWRALLQPAAHRCRWPDQRAVLFPRSLLVPALARAALRAGEPPRSPAPPRPAAAPLSPSPPAGHLPADQLLVLSLQRTPAAASRMRSPRRASAGPPPRSPGLRRARCSSLLSRGMPPARGNLPVPPLPLALRRLRSLRHPPLATSRQTSFWCSASSGHPPPQRLRCSQASHSGRGFWGWRSLRQRGWFQTDSQESVRRLPTPS